jgi:hypothetical protein
LAKTKQFYATRAKRRCCRAGKATAARAKAEALQQNARQMPGFSIRNCASQGLSRTNQAKFHLRGVWGIEKTPKNVKWSNDCSSDWITLHVGRTQTLQVAEGLNFDDVTSMQCKYVVEVEGSSFSTQFVLGKDFSKYVCEEDWIGFCQCRTE